MTVAEFALLAFFPTLMAFSAASDLVSMTISNRVSLLLLVGFALLAAAFGMPAEAIGMNLLAGLLILVVGFALFAFNLIGGGDAKLMAATAVWMGWAHVLDYMVVAAFLGGPLTFAILAMRKHELPFAVQRMDWIMRLHDKDAGVPYGIALAAAGLILYPDLAIWRAGLGG